MFRKITFCLLLSLITLACSSSKKIQKVEYNNIWVDEENIGNLENLVLNLSKEKIIILTNRNIIDTFNSFSQFNGILALKGCKPIKIYYDDNTFEYAAYIYGCGYILSKSKKKYILNDHQKCQILNSIFLK